MLISKRMLYSFWNLHAYSSLARYVRRQLCFEPNSLKYCSSLITQLIFGGVIVSVALNLAEVHTQNPFNVIVSGAVAAKINPVCLCLCLGGVVRWPS